MGKAWFYAWTRLHLLEPAGNGLTTFWLVFWSAMSLVTVAAGGYPVDW